VGGGGRTCIDGFCLRNDLLFYFLFEAPNGGGGEREKRKKTIEERALERLAKCIKQLYNIELRTFVRSAPGQNGNFVGRDATGKTVSVENDVGSYSSWLLGLKGFAFVPLAGLTVGESPEINDTANNLPSESFYPVVQIHELAHSLEIITSENPYGTSEKSADRLQDCILGSPQ
jgi:hypothetical protein